MNLVAYYEAFSAARDEIDFCGDPVPYNWLELPSSHDLHLSNGMQRYLWSGVAEFQANDIANGVNSLIIHARNFDAWHQVTDGLERNNALKVHNEFIASNVTVALGLPYSLKSRYYFATAHISHHSNRFRHGSDWSESDLDTDQNINQEIAAKAAKGWKSWRKLASELEKCNSSNFRAETSDFRNKYNHRHDLHIGIQAASPMQRKIRTDNGKAMYTFGGTYEIKLKDVSQLLKAEFRAFSKAYSQFQQLVREQREVVFADV